MNIVSKCKRPVVSKNLWKNPGEEKKKNSIKRRGEVSQRKRARTQTTELAVARRSNLSYTLGLQPKKTTGKQDPEGSYDLPTSPNQDPCLLTPSPVLFSLCSFFLLLKLECSRDSEEVE